MATTSSSANGELSESQNEKLAQFQEITGYDDLARCRDILCAHSWDLESAVSTALHLPSPPAADRRRLSVDVPAVDHNYHGADYNLSYWRPRGWLGFGWYVFRWPITFFVRTVYNLMRFAISLIRSDSRLAVTDPEGNVRQFVADFVARYGPATPAFLETSYNQALSRAKTDLRFLLIYLHNESHEDADQFCREILCSQPVLAWLNEHMLVWGCSVQLPEGHKVSRTLKERGYPFVCVVVLRESRMTVVARIQGSVESPDQLISILTTVKADNEASLRAAQLERAERTVNQTLRQQQDEAYLESLRADQEKARKKREDVERKRQAEEDAARAAAEHARAIEQREQRKRELAKQVPAEPAKDDGGAIQLALRLPSGKRIDRRFLQTHSMKYLYYYVLCHEDAPDNFEIHTTYPRRKIPCQPSSDSNEDPPTFREFGLARNESLMVSDLDA